MQKELNVQYVRDWLDSGPAESYEKTVTAARNALGLFQKELAKRIEPQLNQKLNSFDVGSADDKKQVSRWLNAQLAALGLLIKCPKTGEPCIVVGNASGAIDGTFQFNATRKSDGLRFSSHRSTTLPHLSFMPRDPEKWSHVIGE